jgi:muconate cycloisomerase
VKVENAEIWRLALPFRWEFKHALAARRLSENVMLKVALDTGEQGFGECVPREYVTGENAHKVFETLQSRLLPTLHGQRFSSLADLKAFLESVPHEGAAGCAFELALTDAVARQLGQSAHSVIGPARRSTVHYSAVLPSASPKRLNRLAGLVRLLRFRAVKIKLGTSDDDIDRVRSLRERLGTKVDVRVDANCAWDPELALKRIRQLEPLGVTSVEEPIRPRDLDGLAYVSRRSPIPICVDESLVSVADAMRLIERKACHIFNIRISKCGGLLNSLRVADLARKAGLSYQIGCQVGETGMLSAAGRCLLMRLDNAIHAEGSSAGVLLRGDVTTPAVRFGLGGRARSMRGRGFGIDIRHDAVSRFMTHCAAVAVN